MIVYNAIGCNHCLDVIESISRHDLKKCSCGKVFVDGGLEYLRRGYQKISDYIDLSVTDQDDFKTVRQFAYRTGYGKAGTPDHGTFRKTNLCDMTDEHLQNAMDYYLIVKGGPHWLLYFNEKLYRAENEISI